MKIIETFTELNLPSHLADALDRMGFETPTPVQKETISPALAGKDILATAQTGTGKTGAFGIPLLTQIWEDTSKRALILAPTRELAAQIHTVLRQMGAGMKLKGVLVIGGESFGRQARDLEDNWDYIIATPGRLNDHLEQRTANLSDINILILDEVDRMLDMGFLPQLRKILRTVPTERQTLLFSATLPKEITDLANSFLKNPVRVAIGTVTAPTLQVKEETVVAPNEKKNELILKEMEREGKILVFARTKSRTQRVARLLDAKGHDVVLLHGGRSQSQRKLALEKFRNGSHRVMVATDLASRGIDVLDIEHVINYDIPATREDYIHRIGRTGRGGKTGNAVNFLSPGDSEGESVITGKRSAGGSRPAANSGPGRSYQKRKPSFGGGKRFGEGRRYAR